MDFDYGILGGGIAGLCLADRLLGHGKKVILIDPKGIGQGASGTPSALLNPATGRYATQSWKAEECIKATYQTLEKVQKHSQKVLFQKNGIVRPASDLKIGIRMKENLERTKWPEGWCEWLDTISFREAYPGITCKLGGLKINVGATVKLPEFLNAFADYLKSEGVQIIEGAAYTIHDKKIIPEGLEAISCEHFITAAGIHSAKMEPWKELPLNPVKGQIAILKHKGGFPYEPSVSSLGYYTPYDSERLAAGSTYEHDYEHEETDPEGLDYIRGRLRKVMPSVEYHADPDTQWAGVRASTPGRMPVLGTHPRHPEHSVFTGLGSKGLLYSSFLAERMAAFLIHGEALPEEVQLERFSG